MKPTGIECDTCGGDDASEFFTAYMVLSAWICPCCLESAQENVQTDRGETVADLILEWKAQADRYRVDVEAQQQRAESLMESV